MTPRGERDPAALAGRRSLAAEARRRILLLYTGGTIGMRPGVAGLVPTGELVIELERWLEREACSRACDIAFDLHEPLIDSAEAVAGHWSSIARRLWARRASFDAAVVLHGTDTLAYCASALSFLLVGFGKPIILTGAQVPFFLPSSDAPSNVRGAILCARTPEISEACIFFAGDLLRGNRSRKSSTRVGAGFTSPHWPRLAAVGTGVDLNRDALLLRNTASAAPPDLGNASIGLLKLYPGISGREIAAAVDSHVDGLVLELYGSGTGPTLDPSVIRELARAASQHVPLVGVSQCPDGTMTAPRYASSRPYDDLGVINGCDMTPEAALTKLHYLRALAVPPARIAARMIEPVAGELTPMGGCVDRHFE